MITKAQIEAIAIIIIDHHLTEEEATWANRAGDLPTILTTTDLAAAYQIAEESRVSNYEGYVNQS